MLKYTESLSRLVLHLVDLECPKRRVAPMQGAGWLIQLEWEIVGFRARRRLSALRSVNPQS